jgi:hypothetical protein
LPSLQSCREAKQALALEWLSTKRTYRCAPEFDATHSDVCEARNPADCRFQFSREMIIKIIDGKLTCSVEQAFESALNPVGKHAFHVEQTGGVIITFSIAFKAR